MNTLKTKIDLADVKDLVINDDRVVVVDTLLAAIDDLDNRLSCIKVRGIENSTLVELAKILKIVIKMFGGEVLDQNTLEAVFSITVKDMLIGSNVLRVLQDPFAETEDFTIDYEE